MREATIADVPKMFEVRCAVRENHMSVGQLTRAGITPESVSAMICGRDYTAPLIEIDGTVVAFGMAQLSSGYVFAVFVRPEFEGRGFGTAVLGWLESALRAGGASQAWLSTGGDTSMRAHGFYRARGWTASGLLSDGQMRYEKALR